MPMELTKSNVSDHWAAKEFAALPLEIVECFASIVNGCVAMSIWPIQLLMNLMPILGKPSGGERCVAKKHRFYTGSGVGVPEVSSGFGSDSTLLRGILPRKGLVLCGRRLLGA